MNPFSQRSSIPSSIVTSLVGWVGFFFIGPLLYGFKVPSEILFLIAVVSALVQVLIMRVLFFVLQLQRHFLVGAFWGTALAIGMYYTTRPFFVDLQSHEFFWILIYLYIGGPVGAFLSYFYIDDKKIYDANGGKKPDTNYGRDAHWMEPFGFGAIAYLITFFPFQHLDLTINVFIVGAIGGVAAAGASHFSPDKWKNSGSIFLIIFGLGATQGFGTGFLFRAYSDQLYTSYIYHGIAGGILTYAMTFLRGKQLAAKEAKGEL